MTDLLLQAWTAALIETARHGHRRNPTPAWHPGEPLRLLFVGYNGARNTGSDVRVQEMLRQIRHVLGADRVELSVITQNPGLTRGYFEGTKQLRLPDIFPPFLRREIPKHHGVVACEGSMFKSRFADALTTMMIGALGIASARDGLSIGYGAEAGAMSAPLRRLTRRYCRKSLVITRNAESEATLRALGVPTDSGTDTAWTFEPHPPETARRTLESAGWDGATPILAICPIHPFWWPVKASLAKAAAKSLTGAFRESHYRSVYFHASGREVRAAYKRYLGAIAGAVRAFGERRRIFPVLVAMEQLDRDACERLAEKLGGAPVFGSDRHDMFELVAILRQSRWIASSRFHAIVTSMPALVPSVGITMDERIRNLMGDRGHEDLSLEVDAADLEDRLYDALETLRTDEEALRPAIGRCVVRNLERMARMGHRFESEVAKRFPALPTRTGLVRWPDYLPPLSPGLERLVETYDEEETGAGVPDAGSIARDRIGGSTGGSSGIEAVTGGTRSGAAATSLPPKEIDR